MKKNVLFLLVIFAFCSCNQEDDYINNNEISSDSTSSDIMKAVTAPQITGVSKMFSDGESLFAMEQATSEIKKAELINSNKAIFYGKGGISIGSPTTAMYADLRGVAPGKATLKFTLADNTSLTKDIEVVSSVLTGTYYSYNTKKWTNIPSTNMSHSFNASDREVFIFDLSHSDPTATFRWLSLDGSSAYNIKVENSGKKATITYNEMTWDSSDAFLLRIKTKDGEFKRIFTFGKSASKYEMASLPQ